MPLQKATDYRINMSADLHRWRAFIAIAELGSLTRAAVFLDSNQSLLSRQLNALERECGARLFNRTGRGVTLSDAGRKIVDQVKRLLADAEKLDEGIRTGVREPMGRITLGTFASIGPALMRRLFTEVCTAFPGVSLRLLEGSTGQLEEWLAEGRIDIAIIYRYEDSLPEHEYTLAKVDSYLVGQPADPITSQAEVPFSALQDLPFILPTAPNGLRSALDSIARDKGISINAAIETNSLSLMKLLVEKEALYTTLPLHSVWDEVCDGTLQAARIVDPSIGRTISMAFAKSKGTSRAVTAVSAHIIQIFKEMAMIGTWDPTAPH